MDTQTPSPCRTDAEAWDLVLSHQRLAFAFVRERAQRSPGFVRLLGGIDDTQQFMLLSLFRAAKEWHVDRCSRFSTFGFMRMRWDFGRLVAHHTHPKRKPRPGRSRRRLGAPLESRAVVLGGDEEPSFDVVLRTFSSFCAADWIDLGSALAQQTEEGRRLVRLYFFEGLTHKEIAAALGVSKTAVSNRFARVLARLALGLCPPEGRPTSSPAGPPPAAPPPPARRRRDRPGVTGPGPVTPAESRLVEQPPRAGPS